LAAAWPARGGERAGRKRRLNVPAERGWRLNAPAGRRLTVIAVLAAAGWGVLSAEFAWARIAPGPRTPAEVLRMAVTSVAIPPAACAHRLRGEWRARR
jgi:hypothetical protein